MAKGQVGVFAEGNVNGVVDLNLYDGPVELSTRKPEVTFPFTVYSRLSRAFVLIDVETPRNYTPLWRLLLNDFSLTKIFRPNIEVEHEGVRHSSIIYEVTPLLKEGRNEIKVVHKGENPLVVNAIAVINAYEVERFNTSYSFSAGELLIGPGESYEVQCEGECKALVKTPVDSRAIANYGVQERLDSPNYVYELDFDRPLKLVNDSQKGHLKLFALFKLNVRTPKISVNVVRDGTKVKVINDGEVSADRLIVNVLKNGVSQAYKVFDNVSVGKEVEVGVNLDSQGSYSVRVVFSVSGFRKAFDFRL